MSRAVSVRPSARPRDPLAALSSRRRVLATRVLAVTSSIVECVGAGDWPALPRLMSERRALLARLYIGAVAPTEIGCLEALREAVLESDGVVRLVLAGAAGRPGTAGG